jgi:hypothetical protein
MLGGSGSPIALSIVARVTLVHAARLPLVKSSDVIGAADTGTGEITPTTAIVATMVTVSTDETSLRTISENPPALDPSSAEGQHRDPRDETTMRPQLGHNLDERQTNSGKYLE